jgi:hypothetical protein
VREVASKAQRGALRAGAWLFVTDRFLLGHDSIPKLRFTFQDHIRL